MTNETLKWLRQGNKRLEEKIGDQTGVEFKDDYSGRGMMGQKTAAMTCPGLGTLLALIVVATEVVLEEGNREDFNGFVNDLATVSQDSLGDDLIIY